MEEEDDVDVSMYCPPRNHALVDLSTELDGAILKPSITDIRREPASTTRSDKYQDSEVQHMLLNVPHHMRQSWKQPWNSYGFVLILNIFFQIQGVTKNVPDLLYILCIPSETYVICF